MADRGVTDDFVAAFDPLIRPLRVGIPEIFLHGFALCSLCEAAIGYVTGA